MKVTLLRSCTGNNNKVDPARILFDEKKGITALEASKDMLIDKSGGLTTRRGTALVAVGDFISAYPAADGSSFYAVKNWSVDSSIEKVVPKADGSVDMIGIRSGLTYGAKMDFCLVGGLIFYMNGFELGVLDGSRSHNWPVSAWPREKAGAVFLPVPAGSHLDILSGRFIIAYGNKYCFTEHDLWGIIDNNRSWRQMESRILMIYAVGTGVFMSDEKAVYFMAGLDPNKWVPLLVLNYPAKEFCRLSGLVDPSHFGLETSVSSAMFGTVRGPVIGLPDGSCFNLIDKKVTMPAGCPVGSIMVVNETTIIQSGV